MDILYNLGIDDDNIKGMLEQCPEIIDISEKDLNDKIDILVYVGCSLRHIKHILISNPYYLDRSNDDILRLICYLKEIGVSSIGLLFDSNPFLLNKDDFEIKEYINSRIEDGTSLEDIVDEFENNSYIIDEI